MDETTIDALLAELEARLPGVLQTVWDTYASADAERGIEVPLPEPKLYLFGRRMQDPMEFPAVLIWAEGSDIDESGPTSGELTVNATGWSEVSTTLVLAVLLQGDDEQVLERQLMRYRKATWRFLAEHQTISTVPALIEVTPLRVGRESRAAGLRVNSPGVRGVLWDIRATTMESF